MDFWSFCITSNAVELLKSPSPFFWLNSSHFLPPLVTVIMNSLALISLVISAYDESDLGKLQRINMGSCSCQESITQELLEEGTAKQAALEVGEEDLALGSGRGVASRLRFNCGPWQGYGKCYKWVDFFDAFRGHQQLVVVASGTAPGNIDRKCPRFISLHPLYFVWNRE